MEMVKRRNETSHTYDEDLSVEVSLRVKDSYYKAFVDLYEKMIRFTSERSLFT